jgi:pimeloyl-ACP methyl ester carboxylesterase
LHILVAPGFEEAERGSHESFVGQGEMGLLQGWRPARETAARNVGRISRRSAMTEHSSIYRSPEGEAEILALYDEALAALDRGHESLTVGTRYGDTHVLAVGAEDAPPVVFLSGGNFLNPTCLRWFLPLAEDHRLYAPDLVGQPGKSTQTRPSPKGDGHALWIEDVLDGLGLDYVPFVGLSYGAGIAIRVLGHAPERVSRAALVSPAAVAAGPISSLLVRVALPMLLYRLSPTKENLLRAASPILTEPEDLAVRQLGAVYRHVRLDAGLPRMASEQELRDFGKPVAVFASEEDVFFPARRVLARAEEIFPNLVSAECLKGCRHVPYGLVLSHLNGDIRAFLARSYGDSYC